MLDFICETWATVGEKEYCGDGGMKRLHDKVRKHMGDKIRNVNNQLQRERERGKDR